MTETDQLERSPLHYAALQNNASEVLEVLRAGADPNSTDKQGFTPLHLAAQEGAVDTLKLLLENGARVDAINIFGNTPLFTAVFNSRGGGEVIELLRSYGADPHRANNAGQSPLGLARLIANFDVAKYFDDLDDHA